MRRKQNSRPQARLEHVCRDVETREQVCHNPIIVAYSAAGFRVFLIGERPD